jgi:hypothetical protein
MKAVIEHQGNITIDESVLGGPVRNPQNGDYLVSKLTGIVYEVVYSKYIKEYDENGQRLLRNTETEGHGYYSLNIMHYYVPKQNHTSVPEKPNALMVWLSHD